MDRVGEKGSQAGFVVPGRLQLGSRRGRCQVKPKPCVLQSAYFFLSDSYLIVFVLSRAWLISTAADNDAFDECVENVRWKAGLGLQS